MRLDLALLKSSGAKPPRTLEIAHGDVPVAEFAEPANPPQPVLGNGKVFTEDAERAVFGPWRRCRGQGGLAWEQQGQAYVRLEDGFAVQQHGGWFRAFGVIGFRRLKVFDPEEIGSSNAWTSGLTIVTTLQFTELTQFSC